MVIAVDKNVPMPDFPGRGGKKYPFAEMEVGDSFVLPPNVKSPYAASGNGAVMLPGRKFKSKKMPNGVWRVFRVS